jgi:Domain of unknown function (DUF5615)
VRLCLDEHYSVRIAEELRGRGRDVVAVKERSDLIALSDGQLWAVMQGERRALLTENVADFVPLVQQSIAAGEDHWGIVFSSARSMPRGSGTIGLFVERLDELLQRHPGEDDFRNGVHWLQP